MDRGLCDDSVPRVSDDVAGLLQESGRDSNSAVSMSSVI
jgi:hypothetical protein